LSPIESEHLRIGNTSQLATAFKVYGGKERLTGQCVFLRRLPDGHVLTDAK
jgi:hypothetical protein